MVRPIYMPDMAPHDLLLFPKNEEHNERTTFCNHIGDKHKITELTEVYTKMRISQMFYGLERTLSGVHCI